MDKNLKMGPYGYKKIEERDLERTKSSKNGTYKVSDLLSPSARGDPGTVPRVMVPNTMPAKINLWHQPFDALSAMKNL